MSGLRSRVASRREARLVGLVVGGLLVRLLLLRGAGVAPVGAAILALLRRTDGRADRGAFPRFALPMLPLHFVAELVVDLVIAPLHLGRDGPARGARRRALHATADVPLLARLRNRGRGIEAARLLRRSLALGLVLRGLLSARRLARLRGLRSRVGGRQQSESQRCPDPRVAASHRAPVSPGVGGFGSVRGATRT